MTTLLPRSPLWSALIPLLGPLVDAVLPPRCPVCGALVDGDHRLCAACWTELRFITDPVCACCGRPLVEERLGETRCAPCLASPPPYDSLRAVLRYDDRSRAVVLKLKHGGRIALAELIARLAGRLLPEQLGEAVLVPVPLHRWRLWRRGFNQSVLVARALSRRHGVALDVDAVRRIRATPPLKGFGPKERDRIVRGAFALGPGAAARLKGRHVVLIDDVYTSGATVGACARLVRRAGARRVSVVCWARVLREGEEGALP